MGDLYKDILPHALQRFGGRVLPQVGQGVVMEQVLGDTGALGLPIQPDAPGAVMDVVAPVHHVDGGVHLDAAGLRAGEVLLVVDVVDMVILDEREHTAQMAHDTGLAAVVNMAPADDVMADVLFGPALDLSQADALPLGLGAVLILFVEPLVVVLRLIVFAQGDAGALGVADLAVLDDPALGPVRTDHSLLIGGGRRPLGGGLADDEPGEGDVVHPGLTGVEAVAPHVDLHILPVGVRSLEVGVQHGIVLLLAGVPAVDGEVRVPGSPVYLGMEHTLQALGLIQGLAV